jgi:spore coat protein U-like protein
MRHASTFSSDNACLKQGKRGATRFEGLLLTRARGLPPAAALAAPGTASFAVDVNVQAGRTVTPSPLASGACVGVQQNATGTVTVTCINSTPGFVKMNYGGSRVLTVYGRLCRGPYDQLGPYNETVTASVTY